MPAFPLPSGSLENFGGGNYLEVGREFFSYFTSLGGLQPDERVLDIGSGTGRMAAPLTMYLTHGTYEGFDVSKEAVAWCKEHIELQYKKFHFQYADLRNTLYNPRGLLHPADFSFPYPDSSFDFVFLTSVFTHLLENETNHYLSEIARVLRPGGRVLATFFLDTAESSHLRLEGKSRLNFCHPFGSCISTHASIPEVAVLYPESLVMQMFEKHRLHLRMPIRYGSWCGRKTFLSFQDLLIAEK